MSETEREELRMAIALFHDYPKKSFGKELSELNQDEISVLFKKMHTDPVIPWISIIGVKSHDTKRSHQKETETGSWIGVHFFKKR